MLASPLSTTGFRLPPVTGSDGPRIDVVVLTWDDGDRLHAALRSIRASVGVQPRIVVVDNGSQPPAVVPDDVTLLRNGENRGVAAARNQGIAAGTADLVCVLDSDAVLEPDALAELSGALGRHGAALAVPVFVGQRPEQSAGRAPTLLTKVSRLLERTDGYAPMATGGPIWEVDFGIGACQLFRRDVWTRVGGIDESFFYGPEDVDFCLRVQDTGEVVVQVAAAQVRHPARRRFRGLLTRRGRQHAWSVVRYLARHRRRLRSGRLRPSERPVVGSR